MKNVFQLVHFYTNYETDDAVDNFEGMREARETVWTKRMSHKRAIRKARRTIQRLYEPCCDPLEDFGLYMVTESGVRQPVLGPRVQGGTVVTGLFLSAKSIDFYPDLKMSRQLVH